MALRESKGRDKKREDKIKKKVPRKGGTVLNATIELAKRRFKLEKGREPKGKEIVDIMKKSYQKVEKDIKGPEATKRAKESTARVASNKKQEAKAKKKREQGSKYESLSELVRRCQKQI